MHGLVTLLEQIAAALALAAVVGGGAVGGFAVGALRREGRRTLLMALLLCAPMILAALLLLWASRNGPGSGGYTVGSAWLVIVMEMAIPMLLWAGLCALGYHLGRAERLDDEASSLPPVPGPSAPH